MPLAMAEVARLHPTFLGGGIRALGKRSQMDTEMAM